MEAYESFGECLRRCLAEEHLSASEAAHLVGFRSRNSIFRILNGDTSDEVNSRFLEALRSVLGDAWPADKWRSLVDALCIDRIGLPRFLSNRAFEELLHAPEPDTDALTMITMDTEGVVDQQPFAQALEEILSAERVECVITGCYDRRVMRLLADKCAPGGEQGRLTVRHYIDTTEEAVVRSITGVMPLVGKSWYNARLVGEGSCPEQMLALYRLHAIHINCWDAQGRVTGHQCAWVSDNEFIRRVWDFPCPVVQTLDRLRFSLELLKPTIRLDGSPEDLISYTRTYARMEENCPILSIKPDVHFNCIPPQLLKRSVYEGFRKAGFALGEELEQLIAALWEIHEQRCSNIYTKRKPTHLVFEIKAMERFMRTGMMKDHLYMQEPYTVAERREIIRTLRDAMLEQPYFNIHFLREHIDLRHEMSCYGDQGVMIMDACNGYDFKSNHSEALIALPVFVKRFQEYFYDELLKDEVLSREQTLRELERLMLMQVVE